MRTRKAGESDSIAPPHQSSGRAYHAGAGSGSMKSRCAADISADIAEADS